MSISQLVMGIWGCRNEMRKRNKIQKKQVKNVDWPKTGRIVSKRTTPQVQQVTIVKPKKRFWSSWKMIEVAAFLVAASAFVVSIFSAFWTRDALVETQLQTQLAQAANQATLVALNETQRQTALSLEANDVTKKQLELAQMEAERGRIVSAWNVLTTKARGNSGKKEALETLINFGVEMAGLDLSCRSMGGWNIEANVCEEGVYLRGMTPTESAPSAKMSDVNVAGADLSDTVFIGADLSSSNFTGAILTSADFSSADVSFSNFANTNVGYTNFSLTDLRYADFTNSTVYDAHFAGAKLGAVNFQGVHFSGVELSGADFCSVAINDVEGCIYGLTQSQVDRAWAWADRPPVLGTDAFGRTLSLPPLCDPALRVEYERKRAWGKPTGC